MPFISSSELCSRIKAVYRKTLYLNNPFPFLIFDIALKLDSKIRPRDNRKTALFLRYNYQNGHLRNNNQVFFGISKRSYFLGIIIKTVILGISKRSCSLGIIIKTVILGITTRSSLEYQNGLIS